MVELAILFPTPLRPSPPPPPTRSRPLLRGSKSAAKSGHESVNLAECTVGAMVIDNEDCKEDRSMTEVPRILGAVSGSGRVSVKENYTV